MELDELEKLEAQPKYYPPGTHPRSLRKKREREAMMKRMKERRAREKKAKREAKRLAKRLAKKLKVSKKS